MQKTNYQQRIWTIFIFGLASGLPISLSDKTLQAWFAMTDVSLQTIGNITLASMPYTFKFLWAPILDKYVPPFLGRRQGWILICQIALIFSLIFMSFCSPELTPKTMLLIAFCIAFFSASQDIAIDAYRGDALDKEEQAVGAAMAVNGWRIAALLSGGIIAFPMLEHFGGKVTYLFMALLMALSTIITISSPKVPQHLPKNNSWSEYTVAPLMEFLKRKKAFLILLFILTYKLGDAFIGSLTYTFLYREINFSLTEIGTIVKFTGFIGTFLGVTIGAWLVLRFGWFYCLVSFGILQAISNLLYMTLLWTGPNYVVVINAIFTEDLFGGMATTAFTGFLMHLCNKKFTAFQYALLTSLSAVGRVFVGPLAGKIVVQFGWYHFFYLSLVISIPSILLLFYLRKYLFEDEIFSSDLNATVSKT